MPLWGTRWSATVGPSMPLAGSAPLPTTIITMSNHAAMIFLLLRTQRFYLIGWSIQACDSAVHALDPAKKDIMSAKMKGCAVWPRCPGALTSLGLERKFNARGGD